MTFKEKLENFGIQHGLSPHEAASIFQHLKDEDKEANMMAGRWNEDADDYPSAMITILWQSYRRVAAQWLAANKPRHWARPMFD
jgi:hypothetical protein